MTRWILAIALVATLLPVAWLGGLHNLVRGASDDGKEGATVSTPNRSQALKRPSTQLVRGIGFVEPAKEIRRLVFNVDGVIENVSAQIGERVAGGEILAVLTNGEEKATVAEAEQQLALAVAERDQLSAGAHPDEIAGARHMVESMEQQLRDARNQHQRTENLATNSAASLE